MRTRRSTWAPTNCPGREQCSIMYADRCTWTPTGFIVVAMHTNSGARQSTSRSIQSTKLVFYHVIVQIFRPSHGSAYSSLAFQLLQAAAFIHVPASHVLFSFAGLSSTFSRILSLASDCAHPFQLVTLCSMASTVMADPRKNGVLVSRCVRVRAQMSEEG